MKPIARLLGCGLLVAPILAPSLVLDRASARSDAPSQDVPAQHQEPGGDPRADCSTGCSAEVRPEDSLPEWEWHLLLQEFARVPLDESAVLDELALDTLLFHAKRVRSLAADHGWPWLDDAHAAFLERELARERAVLEVRMVSVDGRERVRLEPRVIPFGIKQHLVPERLDDLQPPEISGTAVRVGLGHIWVRL